MSVFGRSTLSDEHVPWRRRGGRGGADVPNMEDNGMAPTNTKPDCAKIEAHRKNPTVA
jgi:hypothetical protein